MTHLGRTAPNYENGVWTMFEEEEEVDPDIREKLLGHAQKLGEVSLLPTVAREVMVLLGTPSVAMARVAQTVKQDPAMAANGSGSRTRRPSRGTALLPRSATGWCASASRAPVASCTKRRRRASSR